MKRMTPAEYKGEANCRLGAVVSSLIAAHGTWSTEKILTEMVLKLKEKRDELRAINKEQRQLRKSHRARKACDRRPVPDAPEVPGQA